jgi:hypothetical protein
LFDSFSPLFLKPLFLASFSKFFGSEPEFEVFILSNVQAWKAGALPLSYTRRTLTQSRLQQIL